MDFYDRLALYVEAVGLPSVGVAWDLAQLPLPDEDHFNLAATLGGGS